MVEAGEGLIGQVFFLGPHGEVIANPRTIGPSDSLLGAALGVLGVDEDIEDFEVGVLVPLVAPVADLAEPFLGELELMLLGGDLLRTEPLLEERTKLLVVIPEGPLGLVDHAAMEFKHQDVVLVSVLHGVVLEECPQLPEGCLVLNAILPGLAVDLRGLLAHDTGRPRATMSLLLRAPVGSRVDQETLSVLGGAGVLQGVAECVVSVHFFS